MPGATSTNDGIPLSAVVGQDGTVTSARQRKRRVAAVQTSTVETPQSLARVLTQMQRDHDAVEQTVLACPDIQPLIFEDLAVGSGGAYARIEHNLGRRVRWEVVDWESAYGAHDLRKDASVTTADELVLASYTIGTVTLKVY